MKCQAKTKDGKKCKNQAKKSSKYCSVHKNSKPTSAERELRILMVTEMILKGESRQDIVRYSSKEWEIEPRTVDNYISDAHGKIKESTKEIRDNQIDLAMARLNDLYKKNYQIQDYRECRQVQESIIKLFSPTVKKIPKHGKNPDNVINMTRKKTVTGYTGK